MKCPKCGFVSYAGLDHCKKCGFPFVKAAPRSASSSVISLFPTGIRTPQSSPHQAEVPREPQQPSSRPESAPPAPQFVRPASEPQASLLEDLPLDRQQDAPENANAWREELSERVVNYRRRRARLQAESESTPNLELSFADANDPKPTQPIFQLNEAEEEEVQSPRFEMELGEPTGALDDVAPTREILSSDEPADETVPIDAAPLETRQEVFRAPTLESPMEIPVGFPTEVVPAEEQPDSIILAPLSRRFLGGVIDALVLLSGAALFGFFFWTVLVSFTPLRQISVGPLNLAVLGFISLFYVFAYFSLFCAVAASSPGLLLAGCEIRNLQGEHPTVRESMWRAFGLLVSLAALMLGFLWACVDSDSLTWHDRMSGTVITEEQNTPDPAGLQEET